MLCTSDTIQLVHVCVWQVRAGNLLRWLKQGTLQGLWRGVDL